MTTRAINITACHFLMVKLDHYTGDALDLRIMSWHLQLFEHLQFLHMAWAPPILQCRHLAIAMSRRLGEETNPHNAGEYEQRQGTTTSEHEDTYSCEECQAHIAHYKCSSCEVRLCRGCAFRCATCNRGPFCDGHADELSHTCRPRRPVPICSNSQEFV